MRTHSPDRKVWSDKSSENPSKLAVLVRALTWVSVIAAGISSLAVVRSAFVDDRRLEMVGDLHLAINEGHRELNAMSLRAKELEGRYSEISNWSNEWTLSKRVHECKALVVTLLESYGRMVTPDIRDDLEKALASLNAATSHIREPSTETKFRSRMTDNRGRVDSVIKQWMPIEVNAASFLLTSTSFHDSTVPIETVRESFDAFDKSFEARRWELDHDENAPKIYVDLKLVLQKCESLDQYDTNKIGWVGKALIATSLAIVGGVLAVFGMGWIPAVPKEA